MPCPGGDSGIDHYNSGALHPNLIADAERIDSTADYSHHDRNADDDEPGAGVR